MKIKTKKATRATTHLSNIVVSALRLGTDTDNRAEFIYVTETSDFNVETTK